MTDASQQHDQEQLPPLTNTLGDGYVILEQEKQNILDQVRISALPAPAHSHCKTSLLREPGCPSTWQFNVFLGCEVAF